MLAALNLELVLRPRTTSTADEIEDIFDGPSPQTCSPNVFLNSRFVGRLNRETSGAIDFQYDPSWLEWEHAFPVSLSLPLREDRYVGAPVTAVFDNLLPDSDAIRRRVAERVGAAGADAYSLLTAVGRDCVGARQFLPDGDDPDPAGTIDGRPVDDNAIAQLLNNLAPAPWVWTRIRTFGFRSQEPRKKPPFSIGRVSGASHSARRQRHIS